MSCPQHLPRFGRFLTHHSAPVGQLCEYLLLEVRRRLRRERHGRKVTILNLPLEWLPSLLSRSNRRDYGWQIAAAGRQTRRQVRDLGPRLSKFPIDPVPLMLAGLRRGPEFVECQRDRPADDLWVQHVPLDVGQDGIVGPLDPHG
jgi:hypothetical protein